MSLSWLHAPEGVAHQSATPQIAAFPPIFARVIRRGFNRAP
jgi:hypothetical protein